MILKPLSNIQFAHKKRKCERFLQLFQKGFFSLSPDEKESGGNFIEG